MRSEIKIRGAYAEAEFTGLLYCPFIENAAFMQCYEHIKDKTPMQLISLWIVYNCIMQAKSVPGDFAECGVFRGATAHLIAETMNGRVLHLFDTFTGMPPTDIEVDAHEEGDFSETSLQEALELVGNPDKVVFYAGFVPDTFAGLEHKEFAFVHIDLDLYRSTTDALRYFYPRMNRGGIMLLDDYGRPSCQGVTKAIEEFFADKPENPLPSMESCQAIVSKL